MSEPTTPTTPPAPDGAGASATTPPPADGGSALQTAGTVDTKAEQSKTDGKGDAKTEQPKQVELKAPKGFEAHFEALTAQAKELGLEGERAQKYLDGLAAFDAERTKALDAALAKQDAKWADELHADPEIGGEKFAGAMKDAARALTRFGGKPAEGQKVTPLAALLHQAGLGNNLLVLKAFAAIGRAMGDDTISGTAKPAAQESQRKSDAELFYETPTAAAKEQ